MSDLNVSEIDYALLKENLKSFLKDQSQFSDYNFEGSALNILLDILAYNTHYNAVHTNLAFSEAFLDSASVRENIVSKAYEIGYVPHSKTSSVANITVNFSVSGNPSQYVIPKNTRFTSASGNDRFVFTTTDDIIVNRVNNSYSKTLSIRQGVFNTFTYLVDTNNLGQRFIVPSKDADLSFMTVSVRATQGSTSEETFNYYRDIGIGNISKNTPVYFKKENKDGFFEIFFGNGVLGKNVTNGNVVSLTYLITNGKSGNGCRSFTLSSALPNVSSFTVTTVDNSYGGADIENVDSITYAAPLFYQSQGKAVTESDYLSLVKNLFPFIDDVSVWGGEKNIPPAYGKVFMAAKPKNVLYFSNTIKEQIKDKLKSNSSIIGFFPEIVDPEYFIIRVSSTVRYDSKKFTPTLNLEQKVRDSITSFFEKNANKFKNNLYHSKLLENINSSSDIVVDTVLNLYIDKNIRIIPNVFGEYKVNYNNYLQPNTFTSDEFLVNGIAYRFKDIPTGSSPYTTGSIGAYRMDGNNQVFLNTNSGSINYRTGEVIINNIAIQNVVNNPLDEFLKVSVSPGSFADPSTPSVLISDFNIYTNERNQIIILDENNIDITLIPDGNV